MTPDIFDHSFQEKGYMELTDHEKEVMILAIHREIKAIKAFLRIPHPIGSATGYM